MVLLQQSHEEGVRMGRRLWAAVIASVAMLVFAGAAQAAQHTTVTETAHIHGAFAEPNFDANPCTGAAIANFSAFGNVVEHETLFIEDGQVTEVWAMFTETGKVAITDANGVSFTGHFTVWGTSTSTRRTRTTLSRSRSGWWARTAQASSRTRCSTSRSTRTAPSPSTSTRCGSPAVSRGKSLSGIASLPLPARDPEVLRLRSCLSSRPTHGPRSACN